MDDKFKALKDDIESSAKKTEILPAVDDIKSEIFQRYRINPESLLGIVLGNTGGIIIDDWIRIYGSGELNFIARNALVPFDELVVAEDILGGLFILSETGNLRYFAPDCLEVEEMEFGYSQFLYWCSHGDTDTFYMDYRWDNWQTDTASLKHDEGIAFYPFLWANADGLESRTRKITPIKEIIGVEFEFLRQND